MERTSMALRFGTLLLAFGLGGSLSVLPGARAEHRDHTVHRQLRLLEARLRRVPSRHVPEGEKNVPLTRSELAGIRAKHRQHIVFDEPR